MFSAQLPATDKMQMGADRFMPVRPTQEERDQQVMLEATRRAQEQLAPTDSWENYDNIDPKETKSLDLYDSVTGKVNKHRYLLCPRGLWGFILKSRKWGTCVTSESVLKGRWMAN